MQVNSSYTFQSPYPQPVQTGRPDASMVEAQETQKSEQSKKTQEMTDEQRKNAVSLVEASSKEKQRDIYVKSSAAYQNDVSSSATTSSVKQYMEFAQDVKRSNALNTYVDNGGDFSGITTRPQPL
jgi:hypothetical protein